MKSSKLILAAILISIFATLSGAQTDGDTQDEIVAPASEEYNRIQTTTRVNEFGRIDEVERRKQLDNFLIELQNNPGSAGYIIFYQGKDALPSQYGLKGEELYLSHLRAKNYDESGIVFINAFRERQSTEFWLVPNGGAVPQPTKVIAALEAPKTETFLFHRSHFDVSADDMMLTGALEARARMQEEYLRDNGDFVSQEEETTLPVSEKSPAEINAEMFSRAGFAFADKFKANAEDRGVVMIYADDRMFDVKKLGEDMRNRINGLAAQLGVAPNRLEVVFGGYRRGIEVEMWVVPKAAKAPLAKPAQPSAHIAD